MFKEVKEKLSDFFHRTIIYPYRYIKNGISNLIIWFPTIWNDRQWDHVFFLQILHKKLTLMEKFFREKGIHVGAEKDANKIKYAILIINRIFEDKYYETSFLPHRKKYGEAEFNWVDSNREGYKKLEIVHEKEPITEEEKQEEKKLFKQCSDHETYLENQDLDLLFQHLRKYLRSWWD